MLNIELARIVMAERLRTTDERVRQGRFQRDIAERNAAMAESRKPSSSSTLETSPDPGQRAKPALG
jgi:hypothetical protein